nr:MAG TPA: hypothetical protein [Caudoviricetes sp.]
MHFLTPLKYGFSRSWHPRHQFFSNAFAQIPF